jgi:hypothetical protein
MKPVEPRCTSLVEGAEPPSQPEPRTAATPPARRHLMRNHKRHGSSDANGWNPKPLNLRVGRRCTPAPQPRGSGIDPPPEPASAATGAARRVTAAADGGDRKRRSASCETRCMMTSGVEEHWAQWAVRVLRKTRESDHGPALGFRSLHDPRGELARSRAARSGPV